jgi:hypothetical protein
MKLIPIVVLLAWAFTPGRLITEANARVAKLATQAQRNTARTPVDTERTGADKGYVHGRHCIDGRAF